MLRVAFAVCSLSTAPSCALRLIEDSTASGATTCRRSAPSFETCLSTRRAANKIATAHSKRTAARTTARRSGESARQAVDRSWRRPDSTEALPLNHRTRIHPISERSARNRYIAICPISQPSSRKKMRARRSHGLDSGWSGIISAAHLRAAASLYFLMVISTRRFFWRPSGSSDPSGCVFGATGFFAPQPCVCMVVVFTPCFPNQVFTDAARRSDNFAL